MSYKKFVVIMNVYLSNLVFYSVAFLQFSCAFYYMLCYVHVA